MPPNNQNDAGSELVHEPAFLVLGKLRRAHGVQGEIALEVHTRLLELLDPECIVYVGEEHQPFTIEKSRWKQDLLLLKFLDVDDRTTASDLTNEWVYIKSEELPTLPDDDEFYFHDLLGLEVVFSNGEAIGILEEILETGANDVFLVRNEAGKETLIPVVEEFIIDVDMENEKIIVEPFEWYGGNQG